MKLHHSNQMPPVAWGGEMIVREVMISRILHIFVCFFLLLAASAGIVFLIYAFTDEMLRQKLGLWALSFGLLVCFLFATAFFVLLVAQMRSSNWLMRLRMEEILIKFRSDANARLPEPHAVVLELSYYNIAWARETREWVIRYPLNTEEGPDQYLTAFVDFKLTMKGDELMLLREAVERELGSKIPDGKSATLVRHYPVHLDGDVLRVEWGGPLRDAALRPRLKTVLDFLARHTLVERALVLSVDFTEVKGTGDADGKINELVRRGDSIAAIGIARRVYRFSVADAESYVENVLNQTNLLQP